MGESCTLAPERAIIVTASSGSVFANSWQRILGEARLYWPRKTAEHLHTITGASLRTCYRWLADEARPDAAEILAVLHALRAAHNERGKIFEQFEFDLS